jgi:hypothetical protein
VSSTADTYKNGNDGALPDTSTTNSFAWFGGAVVSHITYKPDTGSSTNWTTSYGFTPSGAILTAAIADGVQRTVSYIHNATGEVIRRDEPINSNGAYGLDPHQVWYRFNGREIGNVINSYGTGNPLNARFGKAYVALSNFAHGGNAGYTASAGETLSSVASQLWGDSSLWYRLAEANGLSSDVSLAEGQHLTIPAGVVRNSNRADTFKPYNPAEALGDTSPTTPEPPKAQGGCGGFGAILVALVSIAVAVALPQLMPFFKTFEGAVLGGMIANTAGQGVGIATGVQRGFDFKGLAMAGVAAGVTAGIGPIANVGNKFANAAIDGMLSNALAQGIGVATGLQSEFDLAGIAAAGVGAGVGRAFGITATNRGSFGARAAAASAGALAGAASRSVLTGTDFGDNILAVLPSVIAQTMGAMAEDAISGSRGQSPQNGAVDPWAPEVWNTLTPEQEWAIISAEYPYSGTVVPDGARPAALAAADLQLQQREQQRVEAEARAAGDGDEIVITAKGAPRVLPASHGYDGGTATGTNDVLWLLNNPEADFAGYFRNEYARGWSDVGAAADAFGKRMLRQVALNGDAWRLERVMPQLAAAAEQDPAFVSLRDSAQSYLDERNQLADAAVVDIGNAMIDYGQLTAVGGVLSVIRDGVRGDLSIDPFAMAGYAADIAGRKVHALRNVANGAAERGLPRVIEGVDASSLSRSHSLAGKASSKDVDRIAASMRNDGYLGAPIDVIEYEGRMIIVDGHHRTAAAMRTGTPVNVQVLPYEAIPGHPTSWSTADEIIRASQTVGPNRLIPPGKYKR